MTFDAPTDPYRLSLVNCTNFVMLDFRVQPKEIARLLCKESALPCKCEGSKLSMRL